MRKIGLFVGFTCVESVWNKIGITFRTDLKPLGRAEVRIAAAFVEHDLGDAFLDQLVVCRPDGHVVSDT